MATVYAETNLLIGLTRGQDPDSPRLLSLPAPHRLVIPAVCVMEAMSAFQRLQSDHNAFWGKNGVMGQRGRELGRDLTSAAAAAAVLHVEPARVATDTVFADVRSRLTSAIGAAAERADLIGADPAVLLQSLRSAHLGQFTDNLILHTILADANGRPGPKLLVTGNSNDFEAPDVVRLLTAAGVDGPCRTAADALGWVTTASR